MARRDLTDRLAGLDGQVSGYEQRLAEAQEAHRLSGVALAQAEAEKGEIATLEAKGALSAKAARERFEEAAGKARRHEGEEERLGLLVTRYEIELEQCRAQLAVVEYEVAAEEARAKHAKTAAAAERLGAALGLAVKESGALVKARSAAESADRRARELAPDGHDLEELSAPSWLPEGWKGLAELLEAEAKERASTRATAAAMEQGRREAAQREDRRRAELFIWKGDSDALAAITNEHTAEEARRQHGVVRRRARQQLDPILDDLRERRTSPARALSDLKRMAQIPADLATATEREILALAGPEAAHAKAFAGLTHV